MGSPPLLASQAARGLGLPFGKFAFMLGSLAALYTLRAEPPKLV